MIPFLLVYQVATAGVGQSLEEVHFDLARMKPSAEAGDIVVTGRRRDHRLHEGLRETEESTLPRAETGLFGKVRGSIEGEQEVLAGGAVSNRAMVKLKIPF